MFMYQVSRCNHIASKLARLIALLVLSMAMVSCGSGGDDADTGASADDSAGESAGDSAGGEGDNQLTADNELSEIFGDWVTGCIPETDANGEIMHHAVYVYSINENTWTETDDQYAVDDPTCSDFLGAATYTYQYEVLDSATAATLDGRFFGNATNVDILDTMVDTFGQADADELGAAQAILLVKDDKLYSRLNFAGMRPTEFLEKYAFSRM